jgi:hypothetical protein
VNSQQLLFWGQFNPLLVRDQSKNFKNEDSKQGAT